MWLTLLGLFIRYGIPILVKSGILSEAKAELIKGYYWAKKNIKTYPEYPTGKNNEKPTKVDKVVNFTSGQKVKRGPEI